MNESQAETFKFPITDNLSRVWAKHIVPTWPTREDLGKEKWGGERGSK